MYAVISDVHGNLDALAAVLADVDALGIRDVRCLGDVVGYGPCPVECVDLVMGRAGVSLLGNHEEALVHGAYGFHLRAKRAIDWTRDVMKPGPFSGLAVRRRWQWVAGLALRHDDGPDAFVHGSPRDPTTEYLLATEVALGPSEKYEEVFAGVERLLFVGHTHLPCVIDDAYEVRGPAELGHGFRPDPGRRAIVNVGSVGQPRDRDPRACYVVVAGAPDRPCVRWRRVAYDVARAQARFAASAELDPALATRLADGT